MRAQTQGELQTRAKVNWRIISTSASAMNLEYCPYFYEFKLFFDMTILKMSMVHSAYTQISMTPFFLPQVSNISHVFVCFYEALF